MLIIDGINDLDFPGGEKVLPWALKLSTQLAGLRANAHRSGMPVIYVNDNCGHWRSNFSEGYPHCTWPGARGRQVSRRLKPEPADYVILKPRHSGFFATSLVSLLEDLKIKRLILSGIATNYAFCLPPHDAHMHQYPIIFLSDCCAAESDCDHKIVLDFGEISRAAMDPLNTHSPASLYEAFTPDGAKRIADKLEIHHTPKHGSWLDMAEIELSTFERDLPERIGGKSAT